MQYLPWFIIAVLILVIAALSIKICILKKSIKEIETEFSERLETDTNTLICISSRDKNIISLASGINKQLRILRQERHRFQQGDTELKNAVTNISHDLRTPLTAICGYLDLLQKEEKSAEAKRYLDIISNRCEILKQLTEELFGYSVILATDKEFNLEKIVINNVFEESIAGFYTDFATRNIEPEIIMPDKYVCCIVNRAGILRVFSNILNNAVKYSDGDLFIEITEDGKIIFENSAAGIDEIQVGRLFDRFYTVEAARNSTGLGLSIVKTLVERMNGTISAEYITGKLRIVLSLPTVENS